MNDSATKLSAWTAVAPSYDFAALKLIERNFLALIDYNLAVDESDLLVHYNSIMTRCVHRHGKPGASRSVVRTNVIASSPSGYPLDCRRGNAASIAPSPASLTPPFGFSHLSGLVHGALPAASQGLNKAGEVTHHRHTYTPSDATPSYVARDVSERSTLPHIWEAFPYHVRHAPFQDLKQNPRSVVNADGYRRHARALPPPRSHPSADPNESWQFWIVQGFSRG